MDKKSSTRRTHATPGIYFKETEVGYSTKSLGITTLGMAGETVKGPAFQSIPISDWREYQTYFGGTNPEKFRGSQYPKYEAPYIAKEYLKQSKKLEFVRVLGLSGVNAGPAWVVTATKSVCFEGYEFEQNFNETVPVEYPYTIPTDVTTFEDKDVYGVYEATVDGGKMYFAFNKPQESENGYPKYRYKDEDEDEETIIPIGIIDGYANQDSDIMYFSGIRTDGTYVPTVEDEQFFDILPEGIKKEFGDVAHLKDKLPAGETAFLYICLDNAIINQREEDTGKGQIVVKFDNGEHGKIAFVIDATTVSETYVANTVCKKEGHYYIIIPKSDFDSAMGVWYAEGTDFNIANISVIQLAYTNSDVTTNAQLVKESGKIFQYTVGDKKTICKEDESGEHNNVAIAVLRSRGEHKKAVQNGTDECGNPKYTFDGIDYYAKNVSLVPSASLSLNGDCIPGYNLVTGDFNIDNTNYGRFTIAVNSSNGCTMCGEESYVKHEYDVSLNPSDKNYIIKVLGTDPEVGDSDVYVEELYDVALEQLISMGEINGINHELAYFPYVSIVPKYDSVTDLLTIDVPTKHELGKRYLYTYVESKLKSIKVRITKDNGSTWEEEDGIVGHIYTVFKGHNAATGKVEYFYGEYRSENGGIAKGGKKQTEYLTSYQYYRDVVKNNNILNNCVKVDADGYYYILNEYSNSDTSNASDVQPITLDFNNYKEEYRYASTPWIVSEMKGSGTNVKLHKLFRFHTISDGSTSNNEVKVSIENIDPDSETFDVVIRSFYDSDVNPQVLERFGKCSLKPGESNYLALKVGDIEGRYVSQSSYVTVEINEDDVTAMSIPCGFLGYPVRNYNGFGIYSLADGESLSSSIKQPYMRFNTELDDTLKTKKQYFGMSDLVGIDEDILSYKGVEAYSDDPFGLTPCFHLDARIINGKPSGEDNGVYYVEDDNIKQVIDVDGITGYTWVTVNKALTTDAGIEPRIGTYEVMENTIYEDKAARKFTVCFYGGWDGWDYYRTSRSIGDEFRANKYQGSISRTSGHGTMFDLVKNPEEYGFEAGYKAITSDYYAYLAAVRQLDNPKTVSINIFATPGIDYVNNTALVEEIIGIVEEERADAVYVVTTPDKPFGAGDSKSEMYTPQEAVDNLEDTEIDTNFACTYYPWEQYYDDANNQYIYLPVTLDVVRNMAYTDNIAYPWYASAGWNRGDVSGVGPRRKLKLGEQDILYEGRINFINSFAKEGDRIWGDKNLQVHDGIMNRISKRRLIIRLKDLLSTSCIGLLFDPNDPMMADTLRSSIKAVLDPVKTNRGITDYRIEINDSDEARDRLELPGKIWVKPTQMLEYISLEFVVTPQGVQWN